LDEVRAVVKEVNKPLSVIAVMIPGVTVAELAEAGVRRISIGGALAQVAYAALVDGAREMRETGSFSWLAKFSPENDIEPWLRRED
jgi:2-methylisocitrate lyase-like PEP mutase family enzyme